MYYKAEPTVMSGKPMQVLCQYTYIKKGLL